MDSVKELLHNEIEQLTDEEARQIMKFAKLLRDRTTSPTLKRLATDALFRVPYSFKAFRSVEAVHGKGAPASTLLVEDRR